LLSSTQSIAINAHAHMVRCCCCCAATRSRPAPMLGTIPPLCAEPSPFLVQRHRTVDAPPCLMCEHSSGLRRHPCCSQRCASMLPRIIAYP
jgi:hypothetical protein